MLDFLLIFSKSGIVLFYYINDVASSNGLSTIRRRIEDACNSLIRNLLLEEKYSQRAYAYDQWQLQYLMDNEFELVYVVGYQKILQLGYVDKLLSELQLLFRDKYRQQFDDGYLGKNIRSTKATYQLPFEPVFRATLAEVEQTDKGEQQQQRQQMKTFQDTDKAKKTASMLEKPAAATTKADQSKAAKVAAAAAAVDKKAEIERNREKFIQKMQMTTSPKVTSKGKEPPSKKQKQARQWELAGTAKDYAELDFSKNKASSATGADGDGTQNLDPKMAEQFGSRAIVGTLKDLQEIDDSAAVVSTVAEDENEWSSEEEVVDDNDEEKENSIATVSTVVAKKPAAQKSGGGMFGLFKSLVGAGKSAITAEQLQPLLERMRIQLIERNVAAEVSQQCCSAVSEKLVGKTLGTFEAVSSVVRQTMVETLTRLLSPQNQVNILRQIRSKRVLQQSADATQKVKRAPYVIVFCGVNGVGKSTNLAKISFWLLENDLRVLIAACDTFRAGAVEQLRTHAKHLNDLHPPNKVSGDPQLKLFERGYGKDAATIAMEAVTYARDTNYDVVLVDTAGRMQDNEPLMKALAKLVKVNAPDLILFVGEALVGNEAVDQLVKFNRALADHSQSEQPRLIDGIVLTKFDTIDDKVGAAVSMSYITNKPIMFVGTGQTYTDLKSINVGAVVSALMK